MKTNTLSCRGYLYGVNLYCPSLGIPAVFFRLFYPYFSLTMFSISSLQFILSVAIVHHFPSSLSRFLFTLSSPPNLGLPVLLVSLTL